MMGEVSIRKGIQFEAASFMTPAEVHEIREKENEVDILFKGTDGISWIEKGWNLSEFQKGFKSGNYKEKEKDNSTVSVW
ncbi:MAG: hypothetical protein QM791_04160 [Ferruginibacter sp.]